VPTAYLALTLAGALSVLLAYFPVKREPLTGPSFFIAWLPLEVSVQLIVGEALLAVVFGVFGAFDAVAGWIGLGAAAVTSLGLAGLAAVGYRAQGVVGAALAELDPPYRVAELPVARAWARWWRVFRAAPLRPHAIQAVHDIDYAGDGRRMHRLDVFRPRGVDLVGAPVMVYFHGGAWILGDKREQGKPMLYELVSRGWVCVAVNYRLSPKATWPDHVVDCKRAIAWVKEHIAAYGGDPSFVAVSGGSAGGHLSSLVALSAGDPTWQPGFEEADTSVQACTPFYGVYDMTGDPSTSGRYGPSLKHLLERRVMKVRIADERELFEQASPTYRVHRQAPPFFVFHGRNDTLVPVADARHFVAALRRVSASPVAYAELPKAQHAFDVLASPRSRATTAGVAAFLEAVRAAEGWSGTDGPGGVDPTASGDVPARPH